MKFTLKQLTVILGSLMLMPLGVFAEQGSAIADEDSAVVKLTSETFDLFMKENPLVLLEFFAPWCGHCKNLGPEFSLAADELVEKDIKLAQIDCTEERQLCQNHGVTGYPTLKVFKSEKSPLDYKGGRTSDSIIEYMIKQSLPSVSSLKTVQEVDALLGEGNSVVVIQVDNSLENNVTFHDIADQLNEKFIFISVPEPLGKFNETKLKYLVYRPSDDEFVEYNESQVDLNSLTKFINTETKPYFGFIDGNTFQDYMAAEIPLAYYFHETEEDRLAVADLFKKLGKEYRGIINFVSIDASKFGRHAVNLNMEEEFPLFAIHNVTSNYKYGLPSSDSLVDEIESFVTKFLNKELEPIIKSEPIPTEEELLEHKVHKLVAKTHDKLINSGKKVFVKYYAPWCGHCKKMAPTLEKLLEIISEDKEFADEIVIANLDGTLNDVDVEITGYPTLILYNGSGEPEVYKGARDMESLALFIGYDLSRYTPEEAEAEEDEETGHDEL